MTTKIKPTLEDAVAELDDQEDKMTLVTLVLGTHYKSWKDSEKEKNETKETFFSSLNTYISETQELPLTTQRILLKQNETIEEALVTRYPDMEVAANEDGEPLMDQNPEEDREWIAILRPKVEFMKFSFSNPEDGMVYTRGRADKGGGFDLEGFIDDEPALAQMCVKEVPTFTFPSNKAIDKMTKKDFVDCVSVVEVLDEEKATEMIAEDPSLLAIFDMYRIAPTPSMKLDAPKKARDEQ